MRDGEGAPVFLLAGTMAEVRELEPLVSMLCTHRPIIALCYWQGAEGYILPDTVEAMAEHALAAMRLLQAEGPLLLIGHSLGGLVAHEILCRMTALGEAVQPPILIDTVPPRRSWLPEAPVRSVMRFFALGALTHRADGRAGACSADERLVRCLAAMTRYRPGRHSGRMTFLYAANDHAMAKGWKRLARQVDSIPLPGVHLDLLREGSAARVIAHIVDAAADVTEPSNDRPSALVLTALSWVTTARLAAELDRAGFSVSAVAPSRHPIAKMECVHTFHQYRPLAAERSIRDAIGRVRPDILIAADDHVVGILHRLHADAGSDAPLRALISRSLGDPAMYPFLYDRARMATIARDLQIAVPKTVAISTTDTFTQAFASIGFPAFIKVDGSWGGLGVAEVRNIADVVRVRLRFSAVPGFVRAAKRLLVNGDASLSGLRGSIPALSAQAAIFGEKAIAWAVCQDGEVLAMAGAAVLSSRGSTGPATAIRLTEHRDVTDAVRKITARLGLSGLCGFDFIIENSDGRAYFIELNPRATPTAHLFAESTADPLAIFAASFDSARARPRNPLPAGAERVALYTGGKAICAAVLGGSIHYDLPWHSPALMALAS